ncbi:MAG: homocysteine S-methyltransferase family protein [Geminicoccaceae bacterium]
MTYFDLKQRLDTGGVAILDGGTGTELERRGVSMNPEAWCGPATLDHLDTLEAIHRDYIAAGAEIIIANTFASSRLMLEPAGFVDQVSVINKAAVSAAKNARSQSGFPEVVVAGSLSHMMPMTKGSSRTDLTRAPSRTAIADAFFELAKLHKDSGCDLIMLEMMFHPERMAPAFEAALATGLPVWAGFSARRGKDGTPLSFARDLEIPFKEVVQILRDFDVDAAGVMHSASDVTGDAIDILSEVYDGPLMAYPDSGYFKMPSWQLVDIIAPVDFRRFAEAWVADGVQVIGGCCGLSPEHIAAIASLKTEGRGTENVAMRA